MSNIEFKEPEVTTQHPREMAHETLQDLIEFSIVLEKLSRNTAQRANEPDFLENLIHLIDEISTFTEAIIHARITLKMGLIRSVSLLEADLLSILKDLLHGQATGQKVYIISLLNEYLPTNFEQWRTQGIPELIRSRDS